MVFVHTVMVININNFSLSYIKNVQDGGNITIIMVMQPKLVIYIVA